MKLYSVYIVECADKLLYTGITNDVSRRLDEHNAGLNKGSFTYKRRPVDLIFKQEFNDVNQAIYFEKKIKKWSAQKKRALANDDGLVLKLLAECQILLILRIMKRSESRTGLKKDSLLINKCLPKTGGENNYMA